LQISSASRTPKGTWQVTITNSYSAPVTAFALYLNGEADSPGHQPKSGPLAKHFEDAIPGPVASRIALAPGQSRIFRMGETRWQSVSFTNPAVIYADGASAGDAAVVAHFLRLRRAEAADITDVLAVLKAAQPDISVAPDVAALTQTFTQRRAAHEAVLKDGIQARPPDRVCGSVLVTLRNFPGHESPQAAMYALSAMFTRWLAQLQTSKPAVAGVAGP